MSLFLRRLAAGFAASGFLLSAGPAAAASGGGGPIIIDPCASFTLTLQGCQSPVHSCEVQARLAAKTNPNATCNTLIRDAAISYSAGLPQRSVVVPPLEDATGAAVSSTAASNVVGVQSDDANSRSMSGLNGFYLGTVHRAQAYLPGTTWYASYLASLRQQQRAAWNTSGNVVDSCAEYVFEKYYGYSVFEDATMLSGTNYRSIYNVAYANSRSGPPPASAIGTNSILDPVLRGKDGTPITPAISFASGLPKNEFFTVPLPMNTKVTISKGTADSVVILPGNGGAMITLKDLQRTGLNLAGVVFNDSTLTSTVSAGASYYTESWSWHKAMSTRNASVLDEQLYEMDRLQEDFDALLSKREEMAATIASMLQSKPLPNPTTGNIFYDGYWRDPLWNPDPTRLSGFAQAYVNVLAVAPIAGLTSTSTSKTAGVTTTMASSGGGISATMPGYAEALNTSVVIQACQGNQLICLLYKLAALDNAIEQALVVAQQKGCLTFNTTGPAVCDWSPKRFAKRVMGLYQTEREKNFARCTEYTDDNFPPLKSKAMVVAGKVNYPATNYTTSPTQLELYFTRKDIYLPALSGLVGVMRDPATDAVSARWSSSDTYSMGDETFGASASYEVDASLSNLGASNCALTPELHGKFTATGTALGSSQRLVFAEARVNNVHADIDLDVFDNTVILDVHDALTAGTYNIVSGSKSKNMTFVEASATFTIGPVPVTVGGKIAGTVGLNYSVDAAYKTTAASGCTVNSIGVTGKLEPYASVDGELYVAVDIFIAKVGIKGRIQLVHASVPLNGNIMLAYGLNGLSQLALQMQARADLKFVFLSGSISIFAEVGICPFCADFDANIVSWDGLHYELKLFEKSATFPIVDLQQAISG